METITVYKDLYDADQAKLFDLQMEHSRLRGNIMALAEIIKTNPKFVEDKLNEMKEIFEKGVDI